MKIANIHEAKSNLSKLIQNVIDGEEVIISKAGKPLVKIIPYQQNKEPRQSGALKGKIKIASDFDELPESILNIFMGKGQ